MATRGYAAGVIFLSKPNIMLRNSKKMTKKQRNDIYQ